MLHNLNTKKITEFTTEDTIYIVDPKDERGLSYLCRFVSYDPGNRKVTGIVIDAADRRELSSREGKQLTNRINRCALLGKSITNQKNSYYHWFDHSLYAMHPLEEHKLVENDMHVAKHPSYGLASFGRRSHGGGKSLFGSSIQNKQTITLTISKAEHNRELNNDWYHSRGEIIEIEMSQNQFAELITSFNMGQGTPCTINHINREQYPEPPFISKADIFHGEFKKSMHNYGITVKKLMEQTNNILENKKNIGVGDRDVIKKNLFEVMRFIDDNLPFMAGQFIESMEKTVTEAKGEIEAFVENKIRTAGLEKLGFNKEDNTPLIENK